MFTPREIRDTEFERIVRGYNPEDVDGFLAQLADQIETLESEKAACEKKMMMLAEKLDEMRADGDILRSVLVSAEKMKESIIAEAKQSAETMVAEAQAQADSLVANAQAQAEAMVSEATERSETMVSEATEKAATLVGEAQDRYDSIIGEITVRSAYEEDKLNTLRTEVANFKNTILSVYKQHLELIKGIPEYDEPSFEEEEEVEVVEEAVAEETVEEVVEPVEEPVAEEIVVEEFAAEEPVFTEEPIAPVFEDELAVPAFLSEVDFTDAPAEPMMPELDLEPVMEEEFTFGEFTNEPVAAPVELNEIEPAAADSAFAAFMAETENEEETSRFGKLDFGDSFTFGED